MVLGNFEFDIREVYCIPKFNQSSNFLQKLVTNAFSMFSVRIDKPQDYYLNEDMAFVVIVCIPTHLYYKNTEVMTVTVNKTSSIAYPFAGYLERYEICTTDISFRALVLATESDYNYIKSNCAVGKYYFAVVEPYDENFVNPFDSLVYKFSIALRLRDDNFAPGIAREKQQQPFGYWNEKEWKYTQFWLINCSFYNENHQLFHFDSDIQNNLFDCDKCAKRKFFFAKFIETEYLSYFRFYSPYHFRNTFNSVSLY